MTFQDKEIPSSAAANTLFNKEKRVNSYYELTVSFGTDAAATELETLTPVGLNTSTGKWGKWLAPDPTVLVVTMDGSTGGTWGVTVNSLVLANTTFAHNATAAVVTEALRTAGYNVSVDLTAAVYTLTFDDPAQIISLPTVSGDVTQLTGGTTPTAVATAGTATAGLDTIRGFVYPEEITLSATEDTIGVISVNGEYNYTDILANVAAGDATALQTALKAYMIEKGIIIQGLAGIA